MTLNEVLQALKAKGLGCIDMLTGETTIETAQLSEDINGDGGLVVSWKSADSGVIRAGDMLLGYVMMESYVPTLQDDGTYHWSPKWSAPAALLKKTPYSKNLSMVVGNGPFVEVAVAADDVSELEDNMNLYHDGDLAIVEHQTKLYVFTVTEGQGGSQSGAWGESDVDCVVGRFYHNAETDEIWKYKGANTSNSSASYWESVNSEQTEVYTHAFCGKVSTIVADMNTFLYNTLGDGWSISLLDNNQTHALANTCITCTFDGASVYSAIDEIANKAAEAYDGDEAVNLYFVGKEIRIGLSNAYAADEYYNRFIILGGTRNMAKRVPAGNAYAAITQRLQVPAGTYVRRADGKGTIQDRNTIEGGIHQTGDKEFTIANGSVLDMRTNPATEAPMTRFLVWDDIYPKLNLTVSAVHCRECYLLDENGDKIPDGNGGYKKYAKWYIKLRNGNDQNDYVVNNSYIIQDKPLSILFQSGALTGREFEVVNFTAGNIRLEKDEDDAGNGYTPHVGELRIIVKADGDILLPTLPATYSNGGLCPNVGDTVTLVNVAIEDTFKRTAQMKLLKKGYQMAKLISSGKQAMWNEEREVADMITGEGGETPELGAGVGEQANGYVVTSIDTNLVTGEKSYSWGTFKPKGLLSSAIDKIGSLSLSGGEASFAPLVEVSNEDTEKQVIYVSNSQGGGGEDTTQTNTTASETTLRQAGGNTSMTDVSDTTQRLSRNEIIVQLATKLLDQLKTKFYNKRNDSGDAPNFIRVDLAYSGNPSIPNFNSDKDMWCGGIMSSQGGDHSVSNGFTDDSDLTITRLFLELKSYTGYSSGFKFWKSCHASAQLYDVCVIDATYHDSLTDEDIFEGIEVWFRGSERWKCIKEVEHGVLKNYSDHIVMAMSGTAPEAGVNYASGIITTSNAVRLFSDTTYGGKTLAAALFDLWNEVEHYVVVNNVEYILQQDGEGDWYYIDGESQTQYPSDEDILTRFKSQAKLSADQIDFAGKSINFSSNDANVNRQAVLTMGFLNHTYPTSGEGGAHGSETSGQAYLFMNVMNSTNGGTIEDTPFEVKVLPKENGYNATMALKGDATIDRVLSETFIAIDGNNDEHIGISDRGNPVVIPLLNGATITVLNGIIIDYNDGNGRT